MKALTFLLLSAIIAPAYGMIEDSIIVEKEKRIYTTAGGNGALFSFGSVTKDGASVRSVPRFSIFLNIGTNVNVDLGKNFGVFSGINLTNVGMITRWDSLKLKQRVYTVGIPLGIKVGRLSEGFIFTGVEAGIPINYKEKRFINEDKKGKFNEWFSQRTRNFMPALFLGFQDNDGFNIKVQYYLGDFLNASFTKDGLQPYAGMKSKLFFISLGYKIEKRKRRRG